MYIDVYPEERALLESLDIHDFYDLRDAYLRNRGNAILATLWCRVVGGMFLNNA